MPKACFFEEELVIFERQLARSHCPVRGIAGLTIATDAQPGFAGGKRLIDCDEEPGVGIGTVGTQQPTLRRDFHFCHLSRRQIRKRNGDLFLDRGEWRAVRRQPIHRRFVTEAIVGN